MFSFLILFFLSTNFKIQAWPTGAGDKACGNLTPHHHDIPPQNLPGNNYVFPYEITYRCRPDGSYEVLITGEPFQGFLLQARVDLTKEAIGTFNVHPDHVTRAKVKNCNPRVADSLTHSSPDTKTTVSGIWFPPENMESQFYFVGTVAKAFDVFWVNKTAKASFPCVSTSELPDKTASNISSPSSGLENSNQSIPAFVLSGGNQTTGNESTVISPTQNQSTPPEINSGFPNASPSAGVFAPTTESAINITASSTSNTTDSVFQSSVPGLNPTNNSTIFSH